ncbi:MAG: hypothetical protein AAF657_34445 [Acidobacteriota bacterium]
MTASAPRKSNGPALTIGLAAFGGGLWLLLNALGVNIPQFKDIWPGLLVLAGLGSLADFFFLGRRPGSVGWAVTWIGFGVLAFALTLNYTTWGKILDWLPSFPTILGLSLLATWLADQRRSDNHMIAGVILVALGLLGYGARFDWLQSILPSAQVVWAVLLLIGGAFLVWRTVLRSK